MGLPPAASKYQFDGIGKAGATATFAALALNPATVWLTQGVWGQVAFFVLTWFYSHLASLGLVVLNIGVADVQVISQQSEFDGSFDDAFKIISQKGSALTQAEKDSIDAKVISAFRKFGSFGGVSGTSS